MGKSASSSPPAASLYEQVASIPRPPGVIGFQIEVTFSDHRVRLYPPALREGGETPARDWFTLEPFETPRGVPEGEHVIFFVNAQKTVLGSAPISYYYRTRPDEVAEDEEEEDDDASEAKKDNSLRRQFGYQQLAKSERKSQAKLTHWKAEAELVLILQEQQRDTMAQFAELRRGLTDETKAQLEASKNMAATVAEVTRLLRETAEAVKMPPPPPPPPPPTDWAGFATNLINGAKDIVKTAIKSGRPKKKKGRHTEVIDAREGAAAALPGSPTESDKRAAVPPPEPPKPEPPKAAAMPPQAPTAAETEKTAEKATDKPADAVAAPSAQQATAAKPTPITRSLIPVHGAAAWSPDAAWRMVKRQLVGLSDTAIMMLLSSRDLFLRFVQHLAAICTPPRRRLHA